VDLNHVAASILYFGLAFALDLGLGFPRGLFALWRWPHSTRGSWWRLRLPAMRMTEWPCTIHAGPARRDHVYGMCPNSAYRHVLERVKARIEAERLARSEANRVAITTLSPDAGKLAADVLADGSVAMTATFLAEDAWLALGDAAVALESTCTCQYEHGMFDPDCPVHGETPPAPVIEGDHFVASAVRLPCNGKCIIGPSDPDNGIVGQYDVDPECPIHGNKAAPSGTPGFSGYHDVDAENLALVDGVGPDPGIEAELASQAEIAEMHAAMAGETHGAKFAGNHHDAEAAREARRAGATWPAVPTDD